MGKAARQWTRHVIKFAIIKAMAFKTKLLLSVLTMAILPELFLLNARAQSTPPQVVVTWQAYGSYIPPGYIGKALPNQRSEIVASLEVLSNGKPVDLSGQTIYWYQNETLIGGGTGKQRIIFYPFGSAPAFLTLEVQLPGYNNESLLIHDVQIPLISPKAVIEAPHPSGQLSGDPIVLQGTPYFFYTSNAGMLSYSWSVNGETSAAAENPETLQINLDPSTPSGSSLAVSLTITDTQNSMASNDSTNIVYVKQL